ncbi:PepSY-associated TM helix domain-containing protein [Acinetobacter sp. ASP199]|uniref:PepSY-associated TM helix domain-containing protein n=1 Tax=unclassified Acinetobacter TaxID=196816 RepID=UPI001F6251AB|nr:PepSY-associated TM helix domain-containing protein [Acinetobacter sp. ASP199]UNT58103.1 PepSY domain-containing protein [Acinetobacter sp. ASP199]
MKIRTDIIRHAKVLHTWVGISTGILLFICFFAGGLSMFQHELSKWATPARQNLSEIQLSQYNELVRQAQAEYPETLKSFQLNFDSKEFHHAPMQWQAPVESPMQAGVDLYQNAMLASLNADGHLQVEQENLSKLGWLIEQLHETAGIPGSLGEHTLGMYVMGFVAVLYFLALMTGLIVLLPTLVKDFFAIRPGKNKKRFWLDAHNVIGITSLPFHIIICVTVISFAYHDVIYDAIGGLVSKDKPLSARPAATKVVEPLDTLDVERIIANIQRQAPDYQVSSISFNHLDNPAKASARANLYSANQMLRGDLYDVMMFNPYQTEAYKTNNLNTHATPMDQVVRSMFSLHFGNYGGDFTRWLYFIFGISGAFLFYSGNILWIESRIKRQKNPENLPPKQRKDVHFIANLSIGACLGCVFAVVVSMALGRWGSLAQTNLQSMNHLMVYSYYAVFLLTIVFCFIRGAGKALPPVLASIAMVLILIAPVSLVTSWLSDVSMPLWWIDLIAILFALIFYRFYQQAKQRRATAEQGSIWS